MEIGKKLIKGIVSEYTGFVWIGLSVGIILSFVGAIFLVIAIIYSGPLFFILGISFLILGLFLCDIFNKIRRNVNKVVNFASDKVGNLRKRVIGS